MPVKNDYHPVKRLFPIPFKLGRISLVRRSEFEHFKAAVEADARGLPVPEYAQPQIETYVPLDQCAAELGVDRRTIGRLMAHARKAAREDDSVAVS
ncbi:hypothetical protein AMST5_03000 [freshwater sediment metagenome]|uniref:Uncharacterized protein n=1 Tax=freshwater sediment metagenome TaxID=556182 RepID=A0AA48M154_9ZZZZ